MKLSGWGRFPVRDCRVTRPRSEDDLRALVAEGAMIARGNGRAYGDAALSERNTVDMRGFNRMISFDAEKGILVAEAGVLLGDIVTAFLPRGWFPMVTPGTKLVTLGGMIAADVHGKNHHRDGSMAASVEWVEVMDADGEVRRASRRRNAELFRWTLGGMGLSGVILRAAIRLIPVESGWIRQDMRPAPDLATAMEIFESSGDATYSVAWIDCLARGDAIGRSLVMLGEHATRAELDNRKRARPFHIPKKPPLAVPFDLPGFSLNRWTVRAFNAAYYAKGKASAGQGYVDWDSYFYPLDGIHAWNRIYGRRGLAQYQCALPLASSGPGLRALLGTIAESGHGSFLAVLKRFGKQVSNFSFPMEGYTLALDFPVSEKSLALLDRLDAIVLDHGGRFYLAKDARMSAETLRRSDPRVADLLEMRGEKERARTFASAQSERLQL